MPYVNALGKVLRESGASTSWIGGSNPGVNVTGTAANETVTGGTNQTLSGGLGDDIYGLTGNATVIEATKGGVDTLSVWASATLPANVENLIMNGGYGWFGFGNELDNIVRGTGGSQQIDGRAGNDVLIGGAGADVFVINKGEGSDLIVDFASGSDRIKLAGYGLHSFEDVRATAKQVGADTVISLTGGEILVLTGVTMSSLVTRDFLYDLDLSTFTRTFADEFDNLSLAVNGGTWRTWYGHNASSELKSRFHNDEAQIYTDAGFNGTSKTPLGLNPFTVTSGVLAITASPLTSAQSTALGGQSYSSGLITTETSFSQRYGYFEIRAALPEGQGMWPAFWLLPADGSWPPEIDVFEMLGKDPDTIYFASHQVVDGQHTALGGQYRIDTSQFHTYGVDWGPEVITYYVDGSAIGTVPTPASMHVPMYMLANLAVGGGWAGAPDTTTGTRQMLIDYIHAYARTPAISGDTIEGTASADVLRGGALNDVINGRGGNDTLFGGTGDDDLFGGAGADYLHGGDGDDILNGGTGADGLEGAGGVDLASYANAQGAVTADLQFALTQNTGEASGDLYYRVEGLLGSAFADDLRGEASGNLILAGSGDDVVYGRDGDDTLLGQEGADRLIGEAGADYLNGGGGDDFLLGGLGADVMDGDAGTDRVSYSFAATGLIVDLQFAASQNTGEAAGDVFYRIEDVIGSAYNDDLRGDAGENSLFGGAGKDVLYGRAGNDTLSGGANADWLIGEAGADRFLFNAGDGDDRIVDFEHGVDRITLSRAAFGLSAALGAEAALTPDIVDFITSGTGATSNRPTFFWNASTGVLTFDANGKAAGDAIHLTTLQVGAVLTLSDLYSIGAGGPSASAVEVETSSVAGYGSPFAIENAGLGELPSDWVHQSDWLI